MSESFEHRPEAHFEQTEGQPEVRLGGPEGRIARAFDEQFWQRYPDLADAREHPDQVDARKMRLLVFKDLRQAACDFGLREAGEPRFVKQGDPLSEIALNLNCLSEGVFDLRITMTSDIPELSIRPTTNYSTRWLQEMFELLAKRGVTLNPVFYKTGETYPMVAPETLPAGSEVISEAEYHSYVPEAMGAGFHDRLIGAKGLRTSHGMIGGPLIFRNGETAIFQTPQGLLKVPMSEVLGPFGTSLAHKAAQRGATREDQSYYPQQHAARP